VTAVRHRALVALGSNSGDRLKNLTEGLAELLRDERLELVKASGVYETEPQDKVGEGRNFYNAVVLLETSLDPVGLIGLLGRIERRFGRQMDRDRSDGGRRLDLDLIYLGDVVYDADGLVVPHPRRRWRDFVLAPANEIAPEFVDPVDRITVGELWEALRKRGVGEPERVAELQPRGTDGNPAVD
jgi:2-amino-4-hydroxy-6-hydroxymethyldihydropteridine diphosphokinase